MLEALSLFSDPIMELLLEEQEVPLRPDPRDDPRGDHLPGLICPVLVGSAYKNKGVQLLLDAVASLPAQPARPPDLWPRTTTTAWPRSPWPPTPMRRWSPWRSSWSRSSSARSPSCGSTRAPSEEGDLLLQLAQAEEGADQPDPPRPCRREGRHRLRRSAGDIVAVMGIECATGDTYCDEGYELLAGEHLRRRAGHRPVDRAQQAGRPGQALQGPEPLHA